MRWILMLLVLALAGCLAPGAPVACARLDLVGWEPEHAVGEEVLVNARLVNCGEAPLAARACPDGRLEVRMRIPELDGPDVRFDPCAYHEDLGRSTPPAEAQVRAGDTLLGGAAWSGKLQTCGIVCDPPRDPPPGRYTLVVTLAQLDATNTTTLVLR